MALVAVSDISHGLDDGEVYYCEAGEEVDESQFSEDELDHLKEIGAVEESKALEETQALRDKVRELEAELAERENEMAITSEQALARRVDQTAIDPLAGVPAGTPIGEDGKPVSPTSSKASTEPAAGPATTTKAAGSTKSTSGK
jgi:hypothetical protein